MRLTCLFDPLAKAFHDVVGKHETTYSHFACQFGFQKQAKFIDALAVKHCLVSRFNLVLASLNSFLIKGKHVIGQIEIGFVMSFQIMHSSTWEIL